MTSEPMESSAAFDIGAFTAAPLRLDMELHFSNISPAAVFDVMGDPEQIQNWYVLAKQAVVDEKYAAAELQFDVDFILFGKIREEVLLWEPPHRYVYRAHGPTFTLEDYVALIEIEETSSNTGIMRWQQYFSSITGEDHQRLMPVILPHINEVSLNNLAGLINGSDVRVASYL